MGDVVYRDPLEPRSVARDEAALALRYDDEFEECFAKAVEAFAVMQAETHGISLEAGRWRASHMLAWLKYPELEEQPGEDRLVQVKESLRHFQRLTRHRQDVHLEDARLALSGPLRGEHAALRELRSARGTTRESRPRRGRVSSNGRRAGPSSGDGDPPDEPPDPLDRPEAA
jgi:hypothetical protein